MVVKSSSSQDFTWDDFGLKLHFRKDSLPEGMEQCTIDIKASLSGQYELPEDSHLVSAVFWLRCESVQKFTRPVTLEIQHCARSKNISKLSIVKAVCSQKQLPYTFRPLGGGTFTSHSSYGIIELNGFSGVAVSYEGSSVDVRSYLISLLCKEVRRPPHYLVEVYIAVIWSLKAHHTVSYT